MKVQISIETGKGKTAVKTSHKFTVADTAGEAVKILAMEVRNTNPNAKDESDELIIAKVLENVLKTQVRMRIPI